MRKHGKRWVPAYNSDVKGPRGKKRQGRKVKGQDGRASMDTVCKEITVTHKEAVDAVKARFARKRANRK
jgi:hypothetical protein